MAYKEWDAKRKGQSWKGTLQETIDRLLPDSCDFDDFLARMRTEGYEVKVGKNLSFRATGQERFTRSKAIGAEYTLEALEQRIARNSRPVEKSILFAPSAHERKVNRLIDIASKRPEGKGAGYEKWAKLFNLKEAANTLNFLTEHGISNYEELAARADEAGEKFDAASARIKQVESQLAELSRLRSHIINYSKTRNIYTAYRTAKDKKAYLAAHRDEIAMHESAKQAFDKLGGKQIPKVAEIREEFSSLLAEKKELYQEYRQARKDMVDLGTARQNIERILNIQQTNEKSRDTQR